MGKKKRSMEEFAAKVDSEGLEYAILHYFSAGDVPDEIAEDWRLAKDALSRIEEKLSPYSGFSDLEEDNEVDELNEDLENA